MTKHLTWLKTGPRSWEVYFGRVLLGRVRREYRIGRGRRSYSVTNTEGQRDYPWPHEWTRLADAVRHLAVMQSGVILRGPTA